MCKTATQKCDSLSSVDASDELTATNCNCYFTWNCVSNKHAPQMPQVCHIWRLVHVQIWGEYVLTCTSYQFTGINNIPRSTSLGTLHIIGIFPWKNIPTTLYMYVPLHCYCSLHIEPILLHISAKKQQTVIFNYHAIGIYVPAKNMLLKCHILATCSNYSICIRRGIMAMSVPCKKSRN